MKITPAFGVIFMKILEISIHPKLRKLKISISGDTLSRAEANVNTFTVYNLRRGAYTGRN